MLSNAKLRYLTLCMPPMTFNIFGMVTVFVHKFSWMINSSVLITMCLRFWVRFQAIRTEQYLIQAQSIFRWWAVLFVSPGFPLPPENISCCFAPFLQRPTDLQRGDHGGISSCQIYFVNLYDFSISTMFRFLVEWFRRLRNRSCPNPPHCFQQGRLIKTLAPPICQLQNFF